MEQQTNFNANATLCRAGCGFFGSSATDGMCSKCFKDASNRKMQTQSSSPSVITVTPASSTSATSADPASPSGIGSMNSSFRDLVTSPVSIPSSSTSSSFASSVPISLTAHMPHPASSISLANAGAASPSSLDIAISNSPSSSSLPGSFSDSASPMSEASKKKNRCAECNKKVGLTGFECRCGGTYCPLHRYSDMHKCDFDYKQMGADEIRKNNPAVRGEKVQKL